MHLKISPGNLKLGEIPSFSITPGKACGPMCSHCLSDCYDRRLAKFRPALKAARHHNTHAVMHNLDAAMDELAGYFRQLGFAKPRLFRIHVGGDFFSVAYWERWLGIIQENPEIRFLAFTKAWDIIPFGEYAIPSNLALIASVWPTMQAHELPPAWMPRTWISDGANTDRIPADAIECPGHCQTCGMCWSLKELGRDVWFHLK